MEESRQQEDVTPWPADGLERVEECPVCGSAMRTLLYKSLTDKVFFCAPGRWTLYRCTDCNSAFLDPRPTTATIALAYSSYFTHELASDDAPQSRMGRIKRGIRNGYLNARYQVQLQPAILAGRWITPLLPAKRRAIDEFVRHLPQKKGGKVADIGCGNGQFLRIARDLGWQAWGVDLDPKAVETAKKTGATVLQGGFPDTGLPSEHFDVVTLSHVIEHVHDPIAALKEAFRILKPGGQIWVATPNLESFGHARFGRDYIQIDSPRHLVLFTLASLSSLLADTGFTNVLSKSCNPNATWSYSCSYRISSGQDPTTSNVKTLPFTLRLAARFAEFRSIMSSKGDENFILVAAKRI